MHRGGNCCSFNMNLSQFAHLYTGITDQFSELMTTEEYDKLYKAIGYEESKEGPNALPSDVSSYKSYSANMTQLFLGCFHHAYFDAIMIKLVVFSGT